MSIRGKRKGRRMAKKKIYAVRKGLKTGLFDSWDTCRQVVEGYPHAEYKGFLSREEACAYLGLELEGEIRREMKETPTGPVAYVDGSYSHELLRYSFGCIILTPQGDEYRYRGSGDNPDLLAIRNVAGEMLGAMYAVRWALKNGYASIELRYDYEGIEKWVTGVWKAKMDLTQKYAEYMRRCAMKVKLTFTKVEAHTGDYYNEEADALAKEGLTGELGIPDVELIS